MAALMAPSRRYDGVMPVLMAYLSWTKRHRDDGLSGGSASDLWIVDDGSSDDDGAVMAMMCGRIRRCAHQNGDGYGGDPEEYDGIIDKGNRPASKLL